MSEVECEFTKLASFLWIWNHSSESAFLQQLILEGFDFFSVYLAIHVLDFSHDFIGVIAELFVNLHLGTPEHSSTFVQDLLFLP